MIAIMCGLYRTDDWLKQGMTGNRDSLGSNWGQVRNWVDWMRENGIKFIPMTTPTAVTYIFRLFIIVPDDDDTMLLQLRFPEIASHVDDPARVIKEGRPITLAEPET